VLCQSAIQGLIDLVEDKVKKVKAGNEGRGQVNIACDREVHVVLGLDGIRGGKNRRASIEGCDDTCFSYRNSLLFLQYRAMIKTPSDYDQNEPHHDFV